MNVWSFDEPLDRGESIWSSQSKNKNLKILHFLKWFQKEKTIQNFLFFFLFLKVLNVITRKKFEIFLFTSRYEEMISSFFWNIKDICFFLFCPAWFFIEWNSNFFAVRSTESPTRRSTNILAILVDISKIKFFFFLILEGIKLCKKKYFFFLFFLYFFYIYITCICESLCTTKEILFSVLIS